MVKEPTTRPLTCRKRHQAQAVEIVGDEFSRAPRTGADNPRTPENSENRVIWLPDQWLGYGKAD